MIRSTGSKLITSALRSQAVGAETELASCCSIQNAILFISRRNGDGNQCLEHITRRLNINNFTSYRGFASLPHPVAESDDRPQRAEVRPPRQNGNARGAPRGRPPRNSSNPRNSTDKNNNSLNNHSDSPSLKNRFFGPSSTSSATGSRPRFDSPRPNQQQKGPYSPRQQPQQQRSPNTNQQQGPYNAQRPNQQQGNNPQFPPRQHQQYQQHNTTQQQQDQQQPRSPTGGPRTYSSPNSFRRPQGPRPAGTSGGNNNNAPSRSNNDAPSSYNNANNMQQQQQRGGGSSRQHPGARSYPNTNRTPNNYINNDSSSNGGGSGTSSNWIPRRKPPVVDIRKNHWLYKDKPQQQQQPEVQQQFKRPGQQKKAKKKQDAEQIAQVIIPDNVTVLKLASLLGVDTSALEKVLAELGDAPKSIQDVVPPDSAELAALEYNKIALFPSVAQDNPEAAVPRPPVVTVMGHVDHGKTSLLDALRSTSVAAREAGGITQHIGAFEFQLPDSQQTATFIDTPGHAAFSAMRARGAAVTDIVVLVVAADDGVMPQTREAMAHAKAAKCPIIVALTKCDLPGADPAKVRQQLLKEGIELEEVGGNVQVVEVAAPLGKGLHELEEAVMLQADLLELKANQDVPAAGVVVEARLDKGQGPTITIIVTKGTLKVGQAVVVGTEWGKVRALKGSGGATLPSALPGQPAEIIGLKGLPLAGDDLLAVADEERAQRVSKARTERSEWRRHSAMARFVPVDENSENDVDSGPKILPVVVKADVSGSVEAVRDALANMSSEAVTVKVVHAGVGPISLSDVQLAIPSEARIFGFNVKPAAEAEAEAKRHNVDLVCRRVIYELLDDVATAVSGAAPKERHEIIAGSAEVLQVFPLTGKRGKKEIQAALIAGCQVNEGSLKSDMKFKVLRDGEVVWEGRVASIRRQKLEVDAVGKGTECGVRLQGWDGCKVGDTLQAIDEVWK